MKMADPLRSEALDSAIRTSDEGVTYVEVLKAAEAYLAFLTANPVDVPDFDGDPVQISFARN